MKPLILSSLSFALLLLAPLAAAADSQLAAEGPPVLFATDSRDVTVVALPDGDVVVGFGGGAAELQRFSVDGTPQATPQQVDGGNPALGRLSLTVDDSGRIVAVLRVLSPFAIPCAGFISEYSLYDADLNLLAPAERFGEDYGDCQAPPVAGGPGGVFSLAFHDGGELHLQRFDRDGVPLGVARRVVDDIVWDYSVAHSRDGEVAVAWTDYLGLGAQLVLEEASGAPFVSADISQFGILPEVIAHPSGAFWGFSLTNADPAPSVTAWRTTAEGVELLDVLGSTASVPAPTGPPWDHLLEAEADERGNTLVVWKGPGDDVTPPRIRARALDSRGRLLGDAIDVDDNLAAEASSFSVTALGPGRFLVLWRTFDLEVYGRVLSLDLSPCTGPASFCHEELRVPSPRAKIPGVDDGLPLSSMRVRPKP